jgi:hypothetical protein
VISGSNAVYAGSEELIGLHFGKPLTTNDVFTVDNNTVGLVAFA